MSEVTSPAPIVLGTAGTQPPEEGSLPKNDLAEDLYVIAPEVDAGDDWRIVIATVPFPSDPQERDEPVKQAAPLRCEPQAEEKQNNPPWMILDEPERLRHIAKDTFEGDWPTLASEVARGKLGRRRPRVGPQELTNDEIQQLLMLLCPSQNVLG